MTDFKKITKKEFDTAYNEHLPSWWIKFVFRFFSKETEKKDLVLSNTLVYTMGGLFSVGFFGRVFNAPEVLVKWATIPLSIILLLIGITMFSGFKLNNWRIGRIRKKLGVTKAQYNYLVNKFYKQI